MAPRAVGGVGDVERTLVVEKSVAEETPDGADDSPADEMTGDDAATNMADFDFDDTWATVTDPDDYPVLQALDEDEQLEAR